MLNKETCKKCWKRAWYMEDDELWEQRKVACRKSYRYLSIKEPPPNDCPLCFEHFIAAGVPDVE